MATPTMKSGEVVPLVVKMDAGALLLLSCATSEAGWAPGLCSIRSFVASMTLG